MASVGPVDLREVRLVLQKRLGEQMTKPSQRRFGRVFVGPIAHDVGPHRGVGHLGGDVEHPGHPLQGVEVFGERLPAPVDALVQGGAGDVLDAFHDLDQEVLRARAHGGEPNPAVSHDDRRHPVPARRGHLRIPRDLAVVVGVDVHPAGGEEKTVGIEPAPARAAVPSNRGDAAVIDGHVPGARGPARAIDDDRVTDDQVVHGSSPVLDPRPGRVVGATRRTARS